MVTDDQSFARLSGARLVARTVRHVFNGPLTTVLGYGELISEDPRVPPPLRARAEEVVQCVVEMAAVLERLPRLVQIAETDSGLYDGPIVDLSKSVFLQEDLAD